MKITIVYPALPPTPDAIGEYTVRLAESLQGRADVSILTAQPDWSPIQGIPVRGALRRTGAHGVAGLEQAIAEHPPDWLLIQYMAFSYGRWGLDPAFPEAVRRVRRRHPHMRLAIMVHEPFVELRGARQSAMGVWQRWQLWRLGTAMDVIFVSIEAWTEHLKRWFPTRSVVHLPVGSNIPRIDVTRAEARLALGLNDAQLALGLFGRFSHGRSMEHVRLALEALQAAGHDSLLVCIGEVGERVREALPDRPTLYLGRISAPEVSRALSALDIALAPFVDGVSTRRGSFVAFLQHGLPTVGTSGHLTDRCLAEAAGRAFLLASAASPQDFADAVVSLGADTELSRRTGAAGLALHEQVFSWERIADRIISTVGQT